MTKQDIKNEYFEWLYDIVCSDRPPSISYRNLLTELHNTVFTYSIEMDENRANNGISLRHKFALEKDYHRRVEDLLDGPCSVLEMMIALAFKMEGIMANAQIGDRTAQWFWQMIVNMELGGMSDDNFNEIHVMWAIERLLSRGYSRDGKGGLFIIRDINRDLRDVEIWNQMCWYLDKIAK